MAGKKRSGRKKDPGPTLASQADIHVLYEESVQNVEYEVDFLQQAFSELRGRKPLSLREDFCGTANAACRWVAVNERHRAVGVDIDPEVLDWGRAHHLAALPEQARSRVTLLEADVRTVQTDAADIVVAFNFSYWYFKQRHVLLDYFRSVHAGLADDGVFFIDAFGGA
ncbi:MAG: class I SAM-dependent methyltransferase, partial [Gammaproteobacteria bacterium]